MVARDLFVKTRGTTWIWGWN